MQAAAERDGPRVAIDAFFTEMCPGLWNAIDEARRDRYRDNAAMLFAALTEPPTPLTRQQLRQVSVPVLVLAGQDSHPALRAITRVLADALPHARLVELADSGHVTYAEQPAQFARAVSAFLTELAGVRGHGEVAVPGC